MPRRLILYPLLLLVVLLLAVSVAVGVQTLDPGGTNAEDHSAFSHDTAPLDRSCDGIDAEAMPPDLPFGCLPADVAEDPPEFQAADTADTSSEAEADDESSDHAPEASVNSPTDDAEAPQEPVVHLPSRTPPQSLAASEVPQFVIFTVDDNYEANGVEWLVSTFYGDRRNPAGAGNPETFDGAPVLGAFYAMGQVEDGPQAAHDALRRAYAAGHEIGNHTYTHTGAHDLDGWLDEIQRTSDWLTRPATQGGLGIAAGHVFGFRAPYLHYNTELYEALALAGFQYDTSVIERGAEDAYWPYTLADGSPGATWLYQGGSERRTLPGEHPELWQIPLSNWELPPELRPEHGFEAGACEWNWIEQAKLAPEDMVRVFEYNLDLRLASNRAPLHLCLHPVFVDDSPHRSERQRERAEAMRSALLGIMEYALSKPEVRIVRPIDVIQWMTAPVPLSGP